LTGLPDGIFQNKKIQIWVILEGLAMEGVGILYGHLVYFTTIWSILQPLGILYGHLV
jgi:hypothetical protein